MNEPERSWPDSRSKRHPFPKRLADALRDPAMDLPVDQKRVEGDAHIVNSDEALHGHGPGFRIHLDFADVAAVGKVESRKIRGLALEPDEAELGERPHRRLGSAGDSGQ